jgi:TRAP-type C4-dicarboxylate transport system substrate-binding protein
MISAIKQSAFVRHSTSDRVEGPRDPRAPANSFQLDAVGSMFTLRPSYRGLLNRPCALPNIKEFLVLDFPSAFASEADAVLDGSFGQKLLELMPAKVLVGLAYTEQGYCSISNSKRPMNKLEDIQGLKIRTIQNPLYIDMLNTLGANAVPMAFTELYTALETSTVGGQENPYSTVRASKFYEVQKYFSNSKHIYNPQLLLV